PSRRARPRMARRRARLDRMRTARAGRSRRSYNRDRPRHRRGNGHRPTAPLLSRRLWGARMSGALVVSPVGDELLDDPAADPRTVAASLRDIAVANRWLGGTRAALHGLGRVLHDVPRGSRVTLLD